MAIRHQLYFNFSCALKQAQRGQWAKVMFHVRGVFRVFTKTTIV